MKKNLILVAIIALLSKVLIAQPTPWVLSGNTPGGGDFLGSTNGADLFFKTNNAQHAVLKASGLFLCCQVPNLTVYI